MDNERNPSFVWQQLHQDPKPSGDRYKRMLDGELPWTTEDPGARFDRAIERLDAEVAQHEGDETAGLEIHNLTDETISYRVLVQDESPLDDLEQTLAVAEEVGIGPSGSVAELAPLIDATPWPELTGDEDAAAYVERLERERKLTDPPPPAEPRHGARLRRWLASTESFMIDQFVDEAGRIADEIDKDADRGRLLVEMSEEIARGRADVAQAVRENLRQKVEEAVERLKHTVYGPGAEPVDALEVELFLAELDRIFGDRPEEHWRCFHCGQTFTGSAAVEHFGRREDADPPTCISTRHPLVGRLRERIRELERPLLAREHEPAHDRRERQAARFEDRDGKVEGVDR